MCEEGELKCSDGRECIPETEMCDGRNDCFDGSDESNCKGLLVIIKIV